MKQTSKQNHKQLLSTEVKPLWRDRKLIEKVQDDFQIGISLICKKKES